MSQVENAEPGPLVGIRPLEGVALSPRGPGCCRRRTFALLNAKSCILVHFEMKRIFVIIGAVRSFVAISGVSN